MSAPKRIQRSRARGWRMPEGAIYVGRPTKWGNPFVVGIDIHIEADDGVRHVKALDRAHAYRLYADSLNFEPHIEEIRYELGGHDLACWCPLTSHCHADILLKLANPKEND